MPTLPPEIGHEVSIEASRPLSAYVDPATGRIRLGIKRKGGGDLFVWMSAQEFQQSLNLLRRSAQLLGIQWPKE